MSKELFTYIQKRALKWDKEKSTDKLVKVITKNIAENSFALYKKGAPFKDQEEHLDLLLDLKKKVLN